jgi:predicted secreted protein
MAATAGIMNGSQLRVAFANDSATPVLVDHLTDLSVSFSTETRDTTTKDNGGYRAILPGLKTLSVTMTAFYAADATNGYEELFADMEAGQKLDITIASYNQAEAEITDDMDIDFKAYCTSLELSAGTEDNASYTATFECVTDPTFVPSA